VPGGVVVDRGVDDRLDVHAVPAHPIGQPQCAGVPAADRPHRTAAARSPADRCQAETIARQRARTGRILAVVTIRIGSADNGGTVTVAPGATVEIALPEKAGTGYRWVLGDLPTDMTLVEERREPGDPPVPGADGQHVFRVRAGASGTVGARLSRPWESGDATREFSVRVAIAEP
jgi:predicted secreted protein